MKATLAIPTLVVLLAAAQNSPVPTQQGLVFQVRAEKLIFKPGEHVWVTALLRNQSAAPLYVPHVMSSCSGYEAHIEFVLAVVKGRLPMSGRGCGVVGAMACEHGCPPGPSFSDKIRTSWVLLRPGEFWGARLDSYLNAPDAPGVYRIRARYVPKPLAEDEQFATRRDNLLLMQSALEADAIEIHVTR